jgi:HAUS augmin-like complex subunit 4
MAMVEDFQHAISVAASGGMRDLQTLFSQLGLRSSPKVI